MPDYSDASCPGNFWLVISNSPGTSQVFVGITDTIAGAVYNLLTNADLAASNGWHLQESLTASSSIVWATPTTVTGTTNLFYMAQIVWPTLLWVTKLPCLGSDFGNGIDSSPALSLDGNHVYVLSTGNALFSINAATGAIEFSNVLTTEGGEMSPSPAIATNGDILVGSADGFLFSFATNLTMNWSNNLGEAAPEVSVFATPAVTAGNNIYLGTDDNDQINLGLTGFFSFTGSNQDWAFFPQSLTPDGSDVESSAAVGTDGTIYFLAEDFRFYALYPDGNVKWFLPVPGATEVDSSLGIGPDGTIYVGSESPYLYAINPDGSLKWTFHVPTTNEENEVVYSSPVIDSNGTVYVGEGFGTVHVGVDFNTVSNTQGGVFAVNDGQLVWAFTNVSGSVVGSMALATDGTVYAGAASSNHTFGILYAITNGMQKWAFQTSNDIVSSPLICSDGSVIITCEDSNVYKIAGCSPLADSRWPMFHHDPQHTGSLAGINSPTIGCEPAFPNNGESSGGQNFTFQVTGRAGSNWSVFASTNLTNMVGWTNTGTIVTLDSTGQGSFSDSNPSQASNVFYFLSNSCCSEVIGFVAFTVGSGTNLVADPFYEVDDSVFGAAAFPDGSPDLPPMNTVGALFCGGNGVSTFPGLIDGVNVIGWTGKVYITNTSFSLERSFVPNGDIKLTPGDGAILDMGSNGSQTIWFSGLVRQAVTNQIAPGTNFLGSALPISGRISTDLGYTNAEAGDLLLKWDPTNQVYINFTNNGGASWSPSEPYIGLCEGFVLHSATNHVWIQKFSPCDND